MTIGPDTIESAEPRAVELPNGAKKNLGFVPNMYGYMAKLPCVLAGDMFTYNDFQSTSVFTPSEQEVVFLTISTANGCTHCTDAHSMIAGKKSGVPADVLETLREGETLPDVKFQALSCLVEAVVLSRGNHGQEVVDDAFSASRVA